MRDAEPRRFLIAAGTQTYQNSFAELPSVPEDLRRVVTLFGSDKYGGYQRALVEVSDNPSSDDYRASVRAWLRSDERDPRDHVIFYYSAHGYFNAVGQYLLAASNTDPLDTDTSIPATFFVQALEASCVRHVLVIIDACFAGATFDDDFTKLVRNLARASASGGAPEIAVLAAARREVAVEGAFSRALEDAVEAAAAEAGERQRYIPIELILGQLNDRLPVYGPQLASLGYPAGITRRQPFIANPSFKPDLPTGIDLETQLRLDKADLLAHWGPRARGVESDLQPGWHFSGRRRVIRALIAWMVGGVDNSPMFVTGAPGSGKSAVLARLVTLSEPALRQEMPPAARDPDLEPPLGLIDAAVHCRGKTLNDVREELCATLMITAQDALELAQFIRKAVKKPVLIFDALDEALEPEAILWGLIHGLAEGGARAVVGVRTGALDLAHDARTIDLDDRENVSVEDIQDYAFRLLAADPAPDGPFADEAAIRQSAALIAVRAKPSFLVARMAAAEAIRSGKQLAAGDWQLTSGRAFDEYLSRFGADERRVRDLLSALAFGEGRGVPKGQIWLTLAHACSGRAYSSSDVAFVLDVARPYIVEDVEQGVSAYRLYHQALADHLKRDVDHREIHATITSMLVLLVAGRNDDAASGWIYAPPYVRWHLPSHAARGERLADLLNDPGFLLSVNPDRLLSAMSSTLPADAQRIADCYRGAVHHLRDRNPMDAAAALEFAACLDGVTGLATRIAKLPWPRSWSTAWAVWEPRSPHRVIGQGQIAIVGPALTRSAEGPIVFAADYRNCVLAWDLASGRPSKHHGKRLGFDGVATTVASAPGSGRPNVVIGDLVGDLACWNPITGQATVVARKAHDGPIVSIGFCACAGESIVASCGLDGALRLWDAASLTPWGDPIVEHPAWLVAIAAASNDETAPAMHFPIDVAGPVGKKWVSLRGRAGDIKAYVSELGGTYGGSVHLDTSGGDWFCSAIAQGDALKGRLVTGSFDGRIRIWDLETGTPVGADMTTGEDAITALWLRIGETAHLVASGGVNGSVHLWDLATRTRIGSYTNERRSAVTALTMSHLHGALLIIAGFEDGTIEIWEDGTYVSRLVGHEGSVGGVAVTSAREETIVLSGGGSSIHLWPIGRGNRGDLGATERFWPRSVYALTVGGVAHTWIAVGTPSGLYLIDRATGDVKPPLLKTMSVDALAFGRIRQCDVVAACDWSGSLRCVNLKTGLPALPGSSRPIPKRWTPVDVRGVAGTLHCLALDEEGALRLIDIENAVPVGPAVLVDWSHRKDSWDIWLVEVAKGPRSVVLDREYGTIMVYDMRQGDRVLRFETDAGFATAVATGIFRGRPVLVSSGPEKFPVQVWDLESGERIACWDTRLGLASAITVGEIDNALIIACQDWGTGSGSLRVWRETDAREIFQLDLEVSVNALAISGSLLLVGTDKGVVALRVHPVADVSASE